MRARKMGEPDVLSEHDWPTAAGNSGKFVLQKSHGPSESASQIIFYDVLLWTIFMDDPVDVVDNLYRHLGRNII